MSTTAIAPRSIKVVLASGSITVTPTGVKESSRSRVLPLRQCRLTKGERRAVRKAARSAGFMRVARS